jgi:hypothetical protein
MQNIMVSDMEEPVKKLDSNDGSTGENNLTNDFNTIEL